MVNPYYPSINGYGLANTAGPDQNKLQSMMGLGANTSDIMQQLLNNLATGGANTAYQQEAFANNMEPGRETALEQQARELNPGNEYQNAQAIRAQGMGNAADQGAQAAANLAASGAGIGAKQGSMVMAMNNANQGANNYLANVGSPQGIAANNSALNNVYGQAMQTPALQSMLGLAGPMAQIWQIQNANDQQSFQDSPIGQLGSLASSFAGPISKGLKLSTTPTPVSTPASSAQATTPQPMTPSAGSTMSGGSTYNKPTFSGGIHYHINGQGSTPNFGNGHSPSSPFGVGTGANGMPTTPEGGGFGSYNPLMGGYGGSGFGNAGGATS